MSTVTAQWWKDIPSVVQRRKQIFDQSMSSTAGSSPSPCQSTSFPWSLKVSLFMVMLHTSSRSSASDQQSALFWSNRLPEAVRFMIPCATKYIRIKARSEQESLCLGEMKSISFNPPLRWVIQAGSHPSEICIRYISTVLPIELGSYIMETQHQYRCKNTIVIILSCNGMLNTL